MSHSIHVVGVKDGYSDKFKKMLKAFYACQDANIPIPKDVDAYFNGQTPDSTGLEVDLEESEAVASFEEEWAKGFKVDLSKLPKDLTHLKFYISW